ncbi:glycosyltransferase [Emticicia sp. CRIBPO]|uniref:glycosyltransferase n=1 Tax=Emticicia sp. CRIBPO TaxID=2683258 RepID=UPI0014136E73|nr:glycosyltransferase [Emticicia sp. CRIBPO]NBA85279.1 glycosyltransferase [Emticicia sp. CRIBPO]
MAFLSVILPVYNGEKYIKESVISILNQTFTDFELFVINDGSQDSTLNELSDIYDERLQVVSNEKNMGLIYSLNRGITLSKGADYIARMDADDISMPDRFQEQIDFLKKNPSVGVVGSAMKYFSDDDKKERIVFRPSQNKQILSTFMFYNPLFHPTVIIKSSILGEKDIYPLNFPKNEDHAFWIELTRKTTFANINKVLLKYRRHDSNVTNTYKDNIAKDFQVNQELLNRFCEKWDIRLQEKQLNTLGIISYKERFKLKDSFTASELLADLELILKKIPKEFDLEYFKNIYCDRCIQYFFQLRKIKELMNFLLKYKYDKFFLLKYAILGKR